MNDFKSCTEQNHCWVCLLSSSGRHTKFRFRLTQGEVLRNKCGEELRMLSHKFSVSYHGDYENKCRWPSCVPGRQARSQPFTEELVGARGKSPSALEYTLGQVSAQ